MAYGKLFESLFTGSMVGSGPTVFAVWTYVIAHAKPPGTVEINPKILATVLGCAEADVLRAIGTLCSPDPASRSPEEDGRRLIPEGPFLYRVPTWPKYNAIRNEIERREQNREAQRRSRASRAVTTGDGHDRSVKSAHADADADVESDPPSIHPSIHQRTVPVPVAARPKEMDGMDGMDGGAPHKSPYTEPEPNPLQDLSPDERRLVAALDRAGYADLLRPNLRITRTLQLAADGLTAAAADRLWAEAKRKGNKPGALFAKWLDSGTWRDVLADLGLAAKERGLRSRAPTAADVGPVFGEVKSIGEIPLSSILAGPGSTRTVQPAPEPMAREPEPPPPRPAPMEPRVEPILTPGSAWAKRRARQATTGGTSEVPDAQVRP